jgi:uncharacterized membrane protein YqjE
MLVGVAVVAVVMLVGDQFRWWWLAGAVLFLAQGIAAGLYAYRRSRSRGQVAPQARLLSRSQYEWAGAGYICAAALFLVSGAAGEGWTIALAGALGCALGGAVRIAMGRRLGINGGAA